MSVLGTGVPFWYPLLGARQTRQMPVPVLGPRRPQAGFKFTSAKPHLLRWHHATATGMSPTCSFFYRFRARCFHRYFHGTCLLAFGWLVLELPSRR